MRKGKRSVAPPPPVPGGGENLSKKQRKKRAKKEKKEASGMEEGDGDKEDEDEAKSQRVTFAEQPEEQQQDEDVVQQEAPKKKRKKDLDEYGGDLGGDGQASGDQQLYIGDAQEMGAGEDNELDELAEKIKNATQKGYYSQAAQLRERFKLLTEKKVGQKRKSGKGKAELMNELVESARTIVDDKTKEIEEQIAIMERKKDKEGAKRKQKQLDQLYENFDNFKRGMKLFVKIFLTVPTQERMDQKLRTLFTSGTKNQLQSLRNVMGAIAKTTDLKDLTYKPGGITNQHIQKIKQELPSVLVSPAPLGTEMQLGDKQMKKLRQDMMNRDRPKYSGKQKQSSYAAKDGQKEEKQKKSGVDSFWGLVSAKPSYQWNQQAEGLMAAYPQWAIRQYSRLQKAKDRFSKITTPLNMISKKDDLTMQQISSLDASLAQWDPAQNKWVGPWVDKKVESIGRRTANLVEKDTAGKELLARQITVKQRKKQVPKLIEQIVDANNEISTSGFGPISSKKGALDLYAGRWYDTATGRVRQLPHADEKYVNPSSKSQVLAYLQASILNDWNLLVGKYQRYKTVSGTSEADFKAAVVKSLKKKLNLGYNSVVAVKRINQIILQFNEGDMNPTSMRWQIMSAIGYQKLDDIYHSADVINNQTKKTKSIKLSQDEDEVNKQKIGAWNTAVNEGAAQVELILRGKAKKGRINQYTLDKLLLKLARSQVSMTSFGTSTIVSGIKELAKCMIIPETGDSRAFINAKEKLDELDTELKKWPAKTLQYRSPAIYKQLQQQIDGLAKDFGQGNSQWFQRPKEGLKAISAELGVGKMASKKLGTALRRIQNQKKADKGHIDEVMVSLQPNKTAYAQQLMKQRNSYKRVGGGDASEYLISDEMDDD